MQTVEATAPGHSPLVSGYARWILLLALVLLASYNVLRLLPSTLVYGARGAADFSIFYAGATILKQGLGSRLYDLAVQAQFQSPFYRTHPLPYNHLAYELLAFRPFASMRFSQAFWSWNAVNLVLIAISSAIVSPHLRSLFRPPAVIAFFATMAFYPTAAALSQGQDSILLLLIFTVTYVLLKSGRDLAAGLVLAMALFKFPLVLPFALPFLLRKRWTFVRGFAFGALLVGAVSMAITGLDGQTDYFRLLRLLARRPEIGYIAPSLMPDARGFMALVLAHRPVAQIVVTSIITLGLLALSTVKFPSTRNADFDLWFALNLFVAAMASPHLYRHDLTPLILAVLLVGNSMLAARTSRIALSIFAVVTLVLFATPVYEVVNDRGVAGWLFLVLLIGLSSITLNLQREVAKT